MTYIEGIMRSLDHAGPGGGYWWFRCWYGSAGAVVGEREGGEGDRKREMRRREKERGKEIGKGKIQASYSNHN